MSNTENEVKPSSSWQEAVVPSLSNDLTDRLVAMWPLRWEERDGDYGRKEVAVCQVWTLDGDEPEPYGSAVPIRWQAVQRQLRRSTAEAPWIVGTVKQKGRSFVLEPPTPRDRNHVTKTLQAVAALIEMGATVEGEYGGDPYEGDDVEPF